MTVDIHRFALMWLVYSRNKFLVGPNLSEKIRPRGNRGPKLSVTRVQAQKVFHAGAPPRAIRHRTYTKLLYSFGDYFLLTFAFVSTEPPDVDGPSSVFGIGGGCHCQR